MKNGYSLVGCCGLVSGNSNASATATSMTSRADTIGYLVVGVGGDDGDDCDDCDGGDDDDDCCYNDAADGNDSRRRNVPAYSSSRHIHSTARHWSPPSHVHWDSAADVDDNARMRPDSIRYDSLDIFGCGGRDRCHFAFRANNIVVGDHRVNTFGSVPLDSFHFRVCFDRPCSRRPGHIACICTRPRGSSYDRVFVSYNDHCDGSYRCERRAYSVVHGHIGS